MQQHKARRKGPRPLAPEERRSEYVRVLLTPAERRALDELSDRLNLTISDVLRGAFKRAYGEHAA